MSLATLYGQDITNILDAQSTDLSSSSSSLQALYDAYIDPDILEAYNERYKRGMSYLEGAGEQEKADIVQAYNNLQSQNQQDLTSRGLTNSTVLSSMRTGAEREKQAELSSLNERLQSEYLAADAQLSGDTLSFAASNFPSLTDIYNIALQYGQSNANISGTTSTSSSDTSATSTSTGRPYDTGDASTSISGYGTDGTSSATSASGGPSSSSSSSSSSTSGTDGTTGTDGTAGTAGTTGTTGTDGTSGTDGSTPMSPYYPDESDPQFRAWLAEVGGEMGIMFVDPVSGHVYWDRVQQYLNIIPPD